MTSAPSAAACSASAKPIRPDERLPTKRTASIGSRVPPAVTSTRTPASCAIGDAPAAGDERLDRGEQLGGLGQAAGAGLARARRAGPAPGSSTVAPRARSVSTFARVAGCSHMWLFIAGATTSGQVAASAALVRRLSARPWASLAIVFADAGAIDEDVGVADELEVRERVVVGRGLARERAARRVALELVGEDRGAGQRGERRGADEPQARRRLHDPHGVARPPSRGGRARAPCRRRSHH